MEGLELKIIMAAVTALSTSIGTLGFVIRWMAKVKRNGGHTPPCDSLEEMRKEVLEDIRKLFARDDEIREKVSEMKTDVEVIKSSGAFHVKALEKLEGKVDTLLGVLVPPPQNTNPGAVRKEHNHGT